MSTQQEPANVSGEKESLTGIRMQTILQINGTFKPEYHEVGEYYQIDIDCCFLDGCGLLVNGRLALSANKGEEVLLEKYRTEFTSGSLHHVDSKHYCLIDNDITFYGPETTPVTAENDANIRSWFDSPSKP